MKEHLITVPDHFYFQLGHERSKSLMSIKQYVNVIKYSDRKSIKDKRSLL